MADPEANPQERINQSTKVIIDLMERLPIKDILHARETLIKVYQEQINSIDEILKKKGYDFSNPPTN